MFISININTMLFVGMNGMNNTYCIVSLLLVVSKYLVQSYGIGQADDFPLVLGPSDSAASSGSA